MNLYNFKNNRSTCAKLENVRREAIATFYRLETFFLLFLNLIGFIEIFVKAKKIAHKVSLKKKLILATIYYLIIFKKKRLKPIKMRKEIDNFPTQNSVLILGFVWNTL